MLIEILVLFGADTLAPGSIPGLASIIVTNTQVIHPPNNLDMYVSQYQLHVCLMVLHYT